MVQWIQSLPTWAVQTVEVLLVVVVSAVLAHYAARLLRHFLKWDINPLPSTSIFVNIARFAVYAVGFAFVLDVLGINPSAVITALGVGGIAVSLGLQDTIANLVSGLQLSLAKIIVPGEYVRVGTEVGVVRDVTWRSTTITTKAGEVIIIPNSVMNKNSVSHLPQLLGVETVVDFVVPLGSDLEEKRAKISKLAEVAVSEVKMRDTHVVVNFKSITDKGIAGTVTAQLKPTTKAGVGSDIIVRAIACELM